MNFLKMVEIREQFLNEIRGLEILAKHNDGWYFSGKISDVGDLNHDTIKYGELYGIEKYIEIEHYKEQFTDNYGYINNREYITIQIKKFGHGNILQSYLITLNADTNEISFSKGTKNGIKDIKEDTLVKNVQKAIDEIKLEAVNSLIASATVKELDK